MAVVFRLSPWQGERTEVRGWSFTDAPNLRSNPHPPPLPLRRARRPEISLQPNRLPREAKSFATEVFPSRLDRKLAHFAK